MCTGEKYGKYSEAQLFWGGTWHMRMQFGSRPLFLFLQPGMRLTFSPEMSYKLLMCLAAI